MKIKLEIEVDTESEQDAKIVEKIVAFVNNLQEQESYEEHKPDDYTCA